MAAFRRRTSFAAPVIITFAAGCSKPSEQKPPPTPTQGVTATTKRSPQLLGEPWHVTMQNMKCFAHESGNPPPPPRAIECPPGMTGNISMQVTQLPDNSCGVVPANCRDVSCVTPKTPCPLPHGQQLVQKLAFVWTIEKKGDKCHAEEADHDCPPGKDCNPPRPRTFPCPPGVTEDKPQHVAELPDATCVIVPDGCTDTSCATEKTTCPK